MMPEYMNYGAGRRGMDGDGDGRYHEGRYRGYEGYGERSENYGNRNYGHNEEMIESLRRDMQNANSEQEKEAIRKLIHKYENN